MFGANSTNNPFGAGSPPPAASSSATIANPPSNVFGSISSGTPGVSGFPSKPNPVNPPPAFGSSNVFGSSVSASGSFANPYNAVTQSSSATAATPSGAFVAKPANLFGQNASSGPRPIPNAFGDATSTNVFGGPSTKNVFESAKKSENVFGTVPTSTSAGNVQPVFGGSGTNKAASVFVSSSMASSSQVSSNVFGGKAFASAAPAKSPTIVFGGNKTSRAETTTSSTFTGSRVFGGKGEKSDNPSTGGFSATSGGSSGVFGKKSPSAVSVFAKKASQGEQSASRERRRSLRHSTDDISVKVAIVCTRVPPQACNKFSLTKHFSKFGEIARLWVKDDKNRATIHFKNHRSAERAMKDGAYILRDQPKMYIQWGKHIPKTDSKMAPDVEDEIASASSAAPGSVFTGRDHKPRRDFKALPALLKSRSVSPEPRRTASPSSRAEKSGAAHVTLKGVGGTAHTTQERVDILVNRDKILRQSDEVQGKHADLATAKALKGTCPDMCPELERYLRESRHRLHRYETLPGTSEADHSKVVKEYSRSSADQGMPLPLEVRPGPVLQMTMDYLLGHIMNKGQDGNWGDWYDFLWNRMRSIRKDITQQHLCDQTAVDLVQKCVRFHVFCAHRLCEEDLGVFDQKINDENLTKCLQTLKECYEDLGSQGAAPAAEEEAEFRAYIVLMNLNQGDVLREVQTFRREVRESSSMRFVVAVYSALNSHNFVRFFRYVRQAPFLMASVLHRYFGQMRMRALRIIIRAYYKERIPLSKFVDQLAFEDENEFAEFCLHHGLAVDGGCVQTAQARFIQPENVVPQKRAVRVIESKQNGSIGDIVNGRPLEQKPPPNPASSFDASSNFVGGNIPIYQERKAPPTEEPKVQPAQPKPQPQIQPAQPAQPIPVAKPEPPPIQYSNETVKELTKEIFREVIDEMALKIVDPMARAIKLYLSQDKALTETLVREIVDPQSKQVAEETHEELTQQAETERKARMQALQAHEKAQSKMRCIDFLMEDILQETLGSEIKSTATQQMDEVVKQLTNESEGRVTQRISDVLMSETTIAMCGSLANEVYQTDVVARLQQLDDAEHAVKIMRTAKFFFAWKNHHAERIRLHRSMMTFPPAPSLTPLSSQLKSILPHSQGIQGDGIHLGGSAFLTTLPLSRIQVSDMRLSLEVSVHGVMVILRRERAWRPLDVCGMLEPSAKQRVRDFPHHETALQWKLVVSSALSDELAEWVKAKLRKGAVESDELLSLYSSQLGNSKASIGVCIRCVHDTDEEDRSLLGAQALLFIVDEEDIMDSRQRLHILVDALPMKPAVPLLIVHSQCLTAPESSLGLSSLVNSKRISGWRSVVIPTDIEKPEASDNLLSGVRWLCDNWPQPVTITRKALREVVEDQVGDRYFNPVSQNLTKLRWQGRLDQDPRLLCELYNSVITHLSVALSHMDLQDYSIPIPEFQPQDKDWNTMCQLKDLRDFLMSLRLPMFVHNQHDSDAWNDACVSIYKWLRTVANQAPALYSRVRWLLKKAEEDFEDLCLSQMRLDKCRPTYVNVPWTEIINACIEHHLSSFDYTEESEVYVYYLKSHLDHFRPPSSWLSADLDESPSGTVNIEDSFVRSANKRLAEASPDEFLRPKVRRILPRLPTLSPSEQETKDISHLLETSIKISQQEGQEYEEYLAKVLEEDSDHLMLTQFGEVVNSDPKTEEKEEEGVSLLEEFNEKKLSLTEGLDLLNDSLVSQKNAGIMYELKLQRMLNDSL